jgi:1,4-dihydroxy-2-naphthoate octaprenyltransferase
MKVCARAGYIVVLGGVKVKIAMWGKALQGVPRITREEWAQLDVVSRWLIATRAMALVLSFFSATMAGILAFRDGMFDWSIYALLTLGLVMAHGTNNLINDWVDYARGVDRGNYFRTQYGPQPLEHGLLTQRQLMVYIAVTGALALLAGIVLVYYRGGLTLPLMIVGAFFVLFYTFPIKYIGLGELVQLMTWGPLMVGGGYYVFTGVWDWNVALAGLAYSLGVSAALFGKHIDKLEMDAAKHIRTLPVLLGERLSRLSVIVMIILQYVLVVYLILIGFFTPILLIVFLSLPTFLQVVLPMYRHPRPKERPANYPESAWPLWFIASAFIFSRRFGVLYIVGLLLDAVWRWFAR